MTREQWRQRILAHFAGCAPGSFLTAYELHARLAPGVRAGRGAGGVRAACQSLVADGLLDVREYRPEGAPYGKPYLSFGRRQ